MSSVSWDAAIKLASCARRELEHEVAQLVELLGRSDAALEALGGDPCRHYWPAFRPLRLSREEDWSDWLAHLIETSTTGQFTSGLFGVELADAARPPDVRREWTLPGGYRADIGVALHSGVWLHVEVKVGDLALDKTFDTGLAMRAKLGETTDVRDFILLPIGDVTDWDEVAAQRERKDNDGGG